MCLFILNSMPSEVLKHGPWFSSVTEVVFSTFNSFDNVLSQVHALLNDVTASQVECKV